MSKRKGKSALPRHRGRRGNFWGDPGNGHPGTVVSRDSMNRQTRAIEKTTRQEAKQEIKEQLEGE